MSATVQFLGSGDAFGSGGRLQTCICVSARAMRFLIDCGATSLTAMQQSEIDPNTIDAVLVSHLHGDHFAGVPFLILDGQFAKRERPLTIVGPIGIEKRMTDAMEVMFPGSSRVRSRFPVSYSEWQEREPTQLGSLTVVPYAVIHPSGSPAYALRIEIDGVTVAYSGDTEWTDVLCEVAKRSHLFVCEAYTFDRRVRFHLEYAAIRERLQELDSRRVILTHMGKDMLRRLDEVTIETAHDGYVVQLGQSG